MTDFESTSRWRISPYPDARDWAFTIVHDADDAFSARLAPLIDVFDQYKIKTSISAFAFWADWADGGSIWSSWIREDPFVQPRAVPLEHPDELDFYKSLVQRGHEVGLHSATDSDDQRSEIQRAFEFFHSEFGAYPPIFVEHRDNLQNHQNEGSDPASPYYVTDLLNRYGPWVWVVSPSAITYNGFGRYFDVLSSQRPLLGWTWARVWGTVKEFIKTGAWRAENGRLYAMLRRGGTPFDGYARNRFGLIKAFRRSGRIQRSDGSGFLEWYQDRHLDLLEQHGGLALVYTHLNTNWLDIKSRQMRPELEQRLAAIASRNVWLATASTTLNRISALKNVFAVEQGGWVKIVNAGTTQVEGLTIVSPDGKGLSRRGIHLKPDNRRRIVIGELRPLETIELQR